VIAGADGECRTESEEKNSSLYISASWRTVPFPGTRLEKGIHYACNRIPGRHSRRYQVSESFHGGKRGVKFQSRKFNSYTSCREASAPKGFHAKTIIIIAILCIY
jgi:hypothetical protein